jgi:hypothetical protein
MEITPNSSVRLTTHTLVSQAKALPPQRGADTAVFDSAEALKQTLQATPLVRPEMVARARQYIGDPQYPPEEIVQRISVLLAMNLDKVTDGSSQNQS